MESRFKRKKFHISREKKGGDLESRKMLFPTNELANKAEINILSARDTTRAWVTGRGIMGRIVVVDRV